MKYQQVDISKLRLSHDIKTEQSNYYIKYHSIGENINNYDYVVIRQMSGASMQIACYLLKHAYRKFQVASS